MTKYTLNLIEAEVGEEIDVPDDAEEVELEYYTINPSIDGEWVRKQMVRIKFLTPIE
ncbi:hypothetical protein [Natrinema sp. DC36]|uniref:hypothetical protein n=1 Tax=Natrinema sp. DC36 TaxID=2878680 RepID=UPI001CF005C6|nr:hypothetical protein [Natrinema sp. DC36]